MCYGHGILIITQYIANISRQESPFGKNQNQNQL